MVLWVNPLERIEGYRAVRVGGVEVDEVGLPTLRNVLQNVLRYVPMRVDEAQAIVPLYVGDGHVLQQGRFAGARLSYDVDVLHPVFVTDAESLVGVSVVGDAYGGYFAALFHALSMTESLLPVETREMLID